LVENNSEFYIRGGTGFLVEGREEDSNRKISEDLILESENSILEDSILFVLI
jgi:hypothetical protein